MTWVAGMLLATALAAALAAAAPARAADAGQEAPLFEAQSTAGTFRLADYRGAKNVLLAFYFKDFTGG